MRKYTITIKVWEKVEDADCYHAVYNRDFKLSEFKYLLEAVKPEKPEEDDIHLP